jgi:hypothetical protein
MYLMAPLKLGAMGMSGTAERRRADRQRVYLAAEIVARPRDSAPPIECAIRSISPLGANLRAPSFAPSQFDLRVVRDGSVRRVRTIWAYGDQRGVAFEHAPHGAAPKHFSICELRRTMRIVEICSDE